MSSRRESEVSWQERVADRAIETALTTLQHTEHRKWQEEQPYEPVTVIQAQESELCDYCNGEGGDFPYPCPRCHDTGQEPIEAPDMGPWEVE